MRARDGVRSGGLDLRPGLSHLGLEAVAGADEGGKPGEHGGRLIRVPLEMLLSFL